MKNSWDRPKLLLLLIIGLTCVQKGTTKDLCFGVKCPKNRCPHPKILRSGECCPICPQEDCSRKLCPVPKCKKTIFKPRDCCQTCPETLPECSEVLCPPAACDNPSVPPGQCCPVCPTVDCRKVRCPRPKCPQPWITKPHECCPSCPSPKHVGCSKVMCHQLQCDYGSPYTVPGECCPICPKGRCHDQKMDKWYPVGPVPTGDPCRLCMCDTVGRIRCKTLDCQVPECLNPVTLPGMCCPKCVHRRCYDSKAILWHPVGPISNSTDPCQKCNCTKEGRIECEKIKCEALHCEKPLHLPGQCCQTCSAPGWCYKKSEKKWYQSGPLPSSDPCDTCHCTESGDIKCTTHSCPRCKCRYSLKLPGRCCRVCSAEGWCFEDQAKKWYKKGPVFSVNPCKMCHCMDGGRITCVNRPCPPVNCRYPLTLPGQCCPVCSAKGWCCDPDTKQWHKKGRFPSRNPCKTNCKCRTDGTITCDSVSCPNNKCKNSYTPKDKCCPTCIMRRMGPRKGLFF